MAIRPNPALPLEPDHGTHADVAAREAAFALQPQGEAIPLAPQGPQERVRLLATAVWPFETICDTMNADERREELP